VKKRQDRRLSCPDSRQSVRERISRTELENDLLRLFLSGVSLHLGTAGALLPVWEDAARQEGPKDQT